MAPPLLSVIVPAHQGAAVLPVALGALAASDLAREAWELIVVDDASDDGTGDVARQWADRVLTLTGRPHGPAYARNRGTEAASGEWLVFIDADVAVHRDTLSRLLEAIAADPSVDAVFGAYDDAPPAQGFLTQYRNLLHRYVHLGSAGAADTFWAGCGAVRRSAFTEVGGFDERRYPRPQIEDIELGYRLRDRGRSIVIRPEIQGAHLKRWTFLGSLRTDLFDRGIPWVTLLLERRRLARPANLNLKRGERAKALLVGSACALLAVAALTAAPARASGGIDPAWHITGESFSLYLVCAAAGVALRSGRRAPQPPLLSDKRALRGGGAGAVLVPKATGNRALQRCPSPGIRRERPPVTGTFGSLELVCPRCRCATTASPEAYTCTGCGVEYPVISGIPDFRIAPDPWIEPEADRAKGLRLERETQGQGLEAMVRAYWAMTPETPPALAERFISTCSAPSSARGNGWRPSQGGRPWGLPRVGWTSAVAQRTWRRRRGPGLRWWESMSRSAGSWSRAAGWRRETSRSG